jgi:hypothetical protein
MAKDMDEFTGGVRRLAQCGKTGGIPDKRADSISLGCCSKAAVFFHSSLRSFFC